LMIKRLQAMQDTITQWRDRIMPKLSQIEEKLETLEADYVKIQKRQRNGL